MTKKVLMLIMPLLTASLLYAQRFTGTYNYSRDICCFSQVDWEINCQVDFKTEGGGSVWLNFPSWKMSVANAKFQQSGKQYSPSDLGLSQWPDLYADNTTDYIKVDLKISYNGKLVKSIPYAQLTSHGIRLADGYVQGNGKSILYFGDNGIPKEEFKVSQLSVSLTNFSNAGVSPGYEQLSQLVSKKESGNANNNTNNQPITLGGSSAENNTTNTNDNAPAVSKETFEGIQETAQMGANLIGGFISDAKQKSEKETRMKLELAEMGISNKNLENCNTPECNNQKGDIYKEMAFESAFKGLSMGIKYNSTLLKIALVFYHNAANAGNIEAMGSLFSIYSNAPTKNKALEKVWLDKLIAAEEKSANSGNSVSMARLAVIYENPYNAYGKAYEDNERALYWLTKSAEAGNENSKYKLAEVYFEGRLGQVKDYQKGLKNALEVFNQQNGQTSLSASSADMINNIYKKGGHGIEKNMELAKVWAPGTTYLNFYDSFKDNEHGWNLSKDNTSSTSIKDDELGLLYNDMALFAYNLDFGNSKLKNKNIEIAAKIRKVTLNNKYVFGIMIGCNEDGSKFELLAISVVDGKLEFSLFRKDSQMQTMFKKDLPTEFKPHEFQELKFRKINDQVQLFLNNKLMGEIKAESLLGDKFGFMISGFGDKIYVKAEDFLLKEIRTK